MKKEVLNGLINIVLFSLLVISFSNFAYAGIVNELFNIPDLSPFFPGFSPFNATITILFNNQPIILDLPSEILVCEGQALGYYFNVSDADVNLDRVDISPVDPFFATITKNPEPGKTVYEALIFSGVLGKNRVNRNQGYRTYPELVSAIDRNNGIDTKNIDITVIEINHALSMSNIGVKTVWTIGDDNLFDYQVQASDIEDGNQNSGNLTFNISFLDGAPRLFNISKNGTMFFDPNVDLNLSAVSLPIIYNISVCVNDTGLEAIHQNISLCNQDGKSMTTCQQFSLTVTNENRAPIITSHYPINLSFKAKGEEAIYFNASYRDPDTTVPDAYWYVDDVFSKYNNGSLFSEFQFSFPCGIGGEHNVSLSVTDGALNSSLQWNISLEATSCPVSSSGGGGGGFSRCEEMWGCFDWNVCQDAATSFEQEILSEEDYGLIKAGCKNDFIPDDHCGFQIRDCTDVNFCNSTRLMPDLVQGCFFVQNPSCTDGVKNCHDNSCELLIDCGGTCGACATCSDKKQNQGEQGIDCGGPCPGICLPKQPFFRLSFLYYFLFFLILLVIIVIVIMIIRIWKARKKINR